MLGFPHEGGMTHYTRVSPAWYIALGLGMAWIRRVYICRASTREEVGALFGFPTAHEYGARVSAYASLYSMI